MKSKELDWRRILSCHSVISRQNKSLTTLKTVTMYTSRQDDDNESSSSGSESEDGWSAESGSSGSTKSDEEGHAAAASPPAAAPTPPRTSPSKQRTTPPSGVVKPGAVHVQPSVPMTNNTGDDDSASYEEESDSGSESASSEESEEEASAENVSAQGGGNESTPKKGFSFSSPFAKKKPTPGTVSDDDSQMAQSEANESRESKESRKARLFPGFARSTSREEPVPAGGDSQMGQSEADESRESKAARKARLFPVFRQPKTQSQPSVAEEISNVPAQGNNGATKSASSLKRRLFPGRFDASHSEVPTAEVQRVDPSDLENQYPGADQIIEEETKLTPTKKGTLFGLWGSSDDKAAAVETSQGNPDQMESHKVASVSPSPYDKSNKPISRRRSLLVLFISAFILILCTMGTAYYGMRLAMQALLDSLDLPTFPPLPAPNTSTSLSEVITPCLSDPNNIVLDFELLLDTQPAKVGFSLTHILEPESRVEDVVRVAAGSLSSFSQMQRRNHFQLCLPSNSSYNFRTDTIDGSGLVSDFFGSSIHGSWTLSYNGTAVASYHGDCTVSPAPTHCGPYCYCQYLLSAQATPGATPSFTGDCLTSPYLSAAKLCSS